MFVTSLRAYDKLQTRWSLSYWAVLAASFALCLILQLASLVPTLSIVAFLAAAMLVIAAYPSSVYIVLLREKLILFPAAVCIVSVLWSSYPNETLYYGLQFLVIAVIAIQMAYWHRAPTIIGIMLASFAYLMISHAAGTTSAWLNQGATISVGINGGKSYIGAIASTAALASAYVIQYGWRRRQLYLLALAGACFGLSVVSILAAKASGAAVGVVINLAVYFGMQWLASMSTEDRSKVLVVAAPFIIIGIMIGPVLWEAVLAFFNKSSDLTGRTFIWERAAAEISSRPLLGTGFNGFWVVGNAGAELIWNYAGITGKAGFNFHNTWLEFVVAFGYPLATALAAFFAFAIYRRYAFTVTTRAPDSAFATAILVDWVSHAGFESGGLGTFNLNILLLYMALSGTRMPTDASRFASMRFVPLAPDPAMNGRPTAPAIS